MADIVDKATRSRMMSAIRGSNTRPEILLRSALHSIGLRYRLHDHNLPGKPDLVFPKYRVVVFVHGCFWHAHSCKAFRVPSTNKEFWVRKFESNRKRDSRNKKTLRRKGWKVLSVWECRIRKAATNHRTVALAAAVAKAITAKELKHNLVKRFQQIMIHPIVRKA